MEATLVETDHVVLMYVVPEDDGAGNRQASGSQLLLVVDQFEVYSVLFRTASTARDRYEINWRGSLDKCLTQFTDEVESFERDFFLERNSVKA